MPYTTCKNCEYKDTENCHVRQNLHGAVLTEDSGCTMGKPKNVFVAITDQLEKENE